MTNTAPTPKITDHDRLGMTLFLAIMLHGIVILGITFTAASDADDNSTPTLDVILVQTHNETTENEDADYYAQVSQLGGTDSDKKTRPTELFTAPTLSQDPGVAIQESYRQEANMRHQKEIALLHQRDSDYSIFTDENQHDEEDLTKEQLEESQQNQNVARLARELDDRIESESNPSKVKYLNSSTKEFIPAQYMFKWIKNVERIGNLNYPDSARRKKLNGTLILDVVINSNGELVKTDLRRSSGHQILDDAAIRIVELAAPYEPFPKELKEIADIIHITRSWEFYNNESIRTN